MSFNELTSGDLRKLSHTSIDLYGATNFKDLGRRITSLVGKVLPVTNSTIWNVDSQSSEQSTVYSDTESEKAALDSQPFYAHYVRRYPTLTARVMHPKHRGKVVARAEILPRSFLASIGYLDEFAKPNYCEYQLAYFFRSKADRFTLISCNRNTREFTDKERGILQFLAPHLQAAFESTTEFETRERSLSKNVAIQQAMPFETIWLDDDFKVLELTPRIPQLIREFFQEDMQFNQLPEKLMDWLRAFVFSNVGAPRAPLILRSSTAALKIRLYPQQLHGLNLLTFHRQLMVPTLDLIKPLGLTRRESEVLLWIAQGKTNHEIALVLGCSHRTVTKHVENLLQKLKVENRLSAILLTLDLLE